jgi:predicted  nucleic acid-binding Zn-ribbon protein
MPDEYITGYPTKPIGGGNPYHMCACCGRSEPEINGRIEGHLPDCSWRLEKEKATDSAGLVEQLRDIAEDVAKEARIDIKLTVEWQAADALAAREAENKLLTRKLDRYRDLANEIHQYSFASDADDRTVIWLKLGMLIGKAVADVEEMK